MKTSNRVHPYLFTDGKKIYKHKKSQLRSNPPIGLRPVLTNRHHLYPKDREEIEGINKEKFMLRLWEYKHSLGWNMLFQFAYEEDGRKFHHELIIDEIITLMIIEHPFMTSQVGSPAWKILFGNKKLHEARDILCRMLYFKFKKQWKHVVSEKVNLAVRKAA
ncbi:MAG: hypothetical protein KBD52_00965 [Candidatus Pacebacteria bacterium]|nr:hypothetical protein [Candidatus Paceibacterota bacterium]